jgi:arylsulfatase A-like enzyme
VEFPLGVQAKLVFLGCLLLAATCVAFAGRDGDARPNVIFLITDDQQRHTFNFLPEGKGKNLTPAIDRLVAEGTVMMGQHVASPVCTPSRFTSLTGRYASRARNHSFLHGIKQADGQSVVGWNSHVIPGEKTVAHFLRDVGYATGFVGKNHVVEVPDFDKISYRADAEDPAVVARLQANSTRVKAALRSAGFDYAASVYHNNPSGNGPKKLAVHNMDWVAKGALDFIDKSHAKPFFLYFATTMPHGPMERLRSWDADPRATAEGMLEEPLQVLPPRASIPTRLKAAGLPLDSHRPIMLAIDDAVAALRSRLEKHAIDDNTVIIYFNDHGQRAKGTLYRGGTEDPSVIWRKTGFPCGKQHDALVSNIDFAPTILDLAGVPAPRNLFDGKSMLPLLKGEAKKLRDSLYFEMGYTRAVRIGDWKLLALHYPDAATSMSLEKRKQVLDRYNAKQRALDKPTFTEDPSSRFSHVSLIPGGGGAEHASYGKYAAYYDSLQLYNLADDPTEQHNLASNPERSGKLKQLQAELKRYLDDLPGEFPLDD